MLRARQKTTTGCLVCRRRRKKCDEFRPRCSPCTRNMLDCHWPSNRQDRVPALATSPQTEPKSVRQSQRLSGGTVPQIRDLLQTLRGLGCSTSQVFDYCVDVFLPSQVHSHSPGENSAVSYMVTMARNYPPLLDALLATTALVMPANGHPSRIVPTMYYHSGIVGLSHDIKNGNVNGTEDHLLATLTWLCAFEVCIVPGMSPQMLTYRLALQAGPVPRKLLPRSGFCHSTSNTPTTEPFPKR